MQANWGANDDTGDTGGNTRLLIDFVTRQMSDLWVTTILDQ